MTAAIHHSPRTGGMTHNACARPQAKQSYACLTRAAQRGHLVTASLHHICWPVPFWTRFVAPVLGTNCGPKTGAHFGAPDHWGPQNGTRFWGQIFGPKLGPPFRPKMGPGVAWSHFCHSKPRRAADPKALRGKRPPCGSRMTEHASKGASRVPQRGHMGRAEQRGSGYPSGDRTTNSTGIAKRIKTDGALARRHTSRANLTGSSTKQPSGVYS